MKLSPKMFETLRNLQVGKTTSFGYTVDTKGPTYINAKTVTALRTRGLLEQCGEMPWHSYTADGGSLRGSVVPVFRISEAGRELLMDCGESIQIEMEPYPIDPQLVQKALDLQAQERLSQWKQQQTS